MVAINFPDSPTNGQEHSGYVWDATNNVWNRLPTLPALDLVNFSAVAPSNPQDGQFWFDTTAGKMYVYYNDGSSAQWVSTLGGLVGQTGTEGQQLIHNGTEWVAYDGKSRNLLYNGAMQVAQRGTSVTGITSTGYYTADRWNAFLGSLGTWTQTIEADGPTGSGFTKSLKMECTTADASPAAGARLDIRQFVEGQDLQGLKKGTPDAESVTLSFWVKSNLTGTYIFSIYDEDNNRNIGASYTINSSATWEKKTIIISPDTAGAIANDNSKSLVFIWGLGYGSDFTSGTLGTEWGTFVAANSNQGQVNLAGTIGNYWQITGVQLETGTIATPFEHKSYSTELAECQRYYQVIVQRTATAQDKVFTDGAMYRSDRFYAVINLSPEMRVTPSIEVGVGTGFYILYANNASQALTGSTFAADQAQKEAVEIYADGMSLTQGSAAWIRAIAADSFIALDSEL